MKLLKNKDVSNLLNKILDEKGSDPDGGGLSWIAVLAISFSVISGIGLALTAAFPGIITSIFSRVMQFFA